MTSPSFAHDHRPNRLLQLSGHLTTAQLAKLSAGLAGADYQPGAARVAALLAERLQATPTEQLAKELNVSSGVVVAKAFQDACCFWVLPPPTSCTTIPCCSKAARYVRDHTRGCISHTAAPFAAAAAPTAALLLMCRPPFAQGCPPADCSCAAALLCQCSPLPATHIIMHYACDHRFSLFSFSNRATRLRTCYGR